MKRSKTNQKPLGDWARKNRPAWTWTYYELAERADISASHAKFLCRKFKIPVGIVTRRVKMADGKILTRRIGVLTPSAVQEFLVKHAGLDKFSGATQEDKTHAS